MASKLSLVIRPAMTNLMRAASTAAASSSKAEQMSAKKTAPSDLQKL
jgi:hypothetical protein